MIQLLDQANICGSKVFTVAGPTRICYMGLRLSVLRCPMLLILSFGI